MSEEGLYHKYDVINVARGEIVRWAAFVLNVEGDPHARMAVLAYAQSIQVENPTLCADLRRWVADLNHYQPLRVSAVQDASGGLSWSDLPPF